MARTTVSLPEDLLERVKVLAAERGSSMAEFIRQAVEEKVATCQPKPRSLGLFESTEPPFDWARRIGEEGMQSIPAWRS